MSSELASVVREPYQEDEVQVSADNQQILKALWGFVAFVSVAFPIVNTIVQLVPMPPGLVAPMAMVSTTLALIAVLYIYVNRRELVAESRSASAFEDDRPNKISARALVFTVASMLCMFAYFVLADVALVVPAVQDAAPAYVYLLKPTIILSYSLFIAATAAAFNLLMMKLFMDEQPFPITSGPVAERRFFSR
jgi:hypothetical protein